MQLQELNERSRRIFREIVETYLASGEPVGSRTLAVKGGVGLSPASIRNTMADLEDAGLIYAPHTSAGRIPTQAGLRLFVDGLLELGDLTRDERAEIEVRCAAANRGVEDVLTEASRMMAGLSHYAGVVVVPKNDGAIRQIEFVSIGIGRALAVIVHQDGQVENRMIDLPPGVTAASLTQAANYLNARLAGKTLEEARAQIQAELAQRTAELDDLTAKVVEAGVAVKSNDGEDGLLIVRGQGNLLDDSADNLASENLERIRRLFDDLENKKEMVRLVDLARDATGVRIYIGSENNLFSLSGSSVIVAPFQDGNRRVVGAIGVIGPTRMNYARIVPMVDYTARVVGRILG